MANYWANPLFPVMDEDLSKVYVATGETFTQGDVILCDVLDTSITDNIEVYESTPVTDVAADIPQIVYNQGFREDTSGRRYDDDVDVTTIVYRAGQTISTIKNKVGRTFEISSDAIENPDTVTLAVGAYLIPQTTSYKLKTAASYTTEALVYKVEYVGTLDVGGNFITICHARVVVGL